MADVSVGFRPPCWCPSRWAPTWRLHTNLYKFGENVSPRISHKKNCCDLNLGGSLCISTIFLFPDSRLNLLNGFDFLFWSILNGVRLKTSNWCFSRLVCIEYIKFHSLGKSNCFQRNSKAGKDSKFPWYNRLDAIKEKWVTHSMILFSLAVCRLLPRELKALGVTIVFIKTTSIIHHNQLLFTKFGKTLRHIESMTSKGEPSEIIEPLTSKWRQKCSLLQII